MIDPIPILFIIAASWLFNALLWMLAAAMVLLSIRAMIRLFV